MIQCILCGEEIESNPYCTYNGQPAHLGCIHDMECPHEEMERL